MPAPENSFKTHALAESTCPQFGGASKPPTYWGEEHAFNAQLRQFGPPIHSHWIYLGNIRLPALAMLDSHSNRTR